MDEKELIRYEYSLFSVKNKAKIKRILGLETTRESLIVEEICKKYSLKDFREKMLEYKINYLKRFDFKADIKHKVGKRANLLCSKCGDPTQYPMEKDEIEVANLSVVAHIYPAKNTGPRSHEWAVSGKSSKFLEKIDNAIFLCVNCSVLIDSNQGKEFTADDLITMKQSHEEKVRTKEILKIKKSDIIKASYYKLLQKNEADIIIELEILIKNKLRIVDDLSNQINPSMVVKERKVVGLSLPNQKLEKIPDIILKFTNLNIISLRNNRIRGFKILGDIQTLEQIHLNGNKIEEIPDEISKLNQLRVLDLKENRISKLNPNLLSLSQLKKLVLSKNQIVVLMEDLDLLSSLETLLLDNNMLIDLPSALFNIKTLKQLDLRNNHFEFNVNFKQEEILKELKFAQFGKSFDEKHPILSQIPKKYENLLDKVECDLEKIRHNKIPIIINLNDLSQLLKIQNSKLIELLSKKSKDFYRNVEIPKKNGSGYRVLDIPNYDYLNKAQYMISKYILQNISISEHAYGFVKESSHLLNAKKHLNSEIIVKLDFKNFFHSIKFSHVLELFNCLGYSKRISACLTSLLLYYNQDDTEPYLPQGTKSSPYLSNIICSEMDEKLVELSEKFNFTYTRYADDITFSTQEKKIPSGFFHAIFKEIHKHGFKINRKKIKIQNRYNRQIVTGILVNHKDPRLPRSYLNELRRKLFELKYKIDDEDELFDQYKILQGECGYIYHINPQRYEKFRIQLKKIKIKKNINPEN